MVQDLHVELRQGMKKIAKLPKGQIAAIKHISNNVVKVIYKDGREIHILLGQDN